MPNNLVENDYKHELWTYTCEMGSKRTLSLSLSLSLFLEYWILMLFTMSIRYSTYKSAAAHHCILGPDFMPRHLFRRPTAMPRKAAAGVDPVVRTG